MTREEEIKQAAIARYGNESQYEIAKKQAFCVGARWADSRPVYFKGQTDKMQESEVAFVDDWMKEHKEQPTYADAIAWAEKKMFEDAFAWLFDNAENYMIVAGTGHWYNNVGLLRDFKKTMMEE